MRKPKVESTFQRVKGYIVHSTVSNRPDTVFTHFETATREPVIYDGRVCYYKLQLTCTECGHVSTITALPSEAFQLRTCKKCGAKRRFRLAGYDLTGQGHTVVYRNESRTEYPADADLELQLCRF